MATRLKAATTRPRSETRPLQSRKLRSITSFHALHAQTRDRRARRRPRRFPTVAVASPALWTSYAEQHAAVPDAFDGPVDFARNDLFAATGRLSRTAVWLSCGTSDPFVAADRAFASRLPRRPAGAFAAGCHDDDFWRRMLPAQVRFVGRRCGQDGAAA